MASRCACLGVRRFAACVAIALLFMVPPPPNAGAQQLGNSPLSVRFGIGVGYTAAPAYPEESPGGDWNGVAFGLVGFRGIPIELRPSVFTYGRGTRSRLVPSWTCITFPGAQCYTYSSGRERATGGSIDAIVRLTSWPIVPYLVGGLGGVGVSRGYVPRLTRHSSGLAYEGGAGARMPIGRFMLFAEAKFFTTRAAAGMFDGYSMHMVPVTVGFTL